MNRIELRSLLAGRSSGTPTGQVVRALSERGSLSATQIARLTGLAKSTVSATLGELRSSGLVVEGTATTEPRPNAGAGRPATMLTLNPEAGTCVGALVGLGRVDVMVADVSHAVIAHSAEELDDDFSPGEAAQVIKRLIGRIYREHSLSLSGMLGVGIAVAGPVNPVDGRVQRASVVPTWAGMTIRETFEPVLNKPVVTDNESNCAALAEMMWGAAVGRDEFLLFKIDLGVGGAIVHGGRVITGAAGGAGEFGHMTIDPDGELCRCGNRGCLELNASAKPALAVASRRFGRAISMDDLIAMAKAGDVGCKRLIADTATAAGRGLGMIGTVLNPPLIVLGGRMALAGELILEPLKASYERHTLVKRAEVPEAARTQIVIGRFTENDSCLGAVGLVLRHHAQRLTVAH